MKYIVTIKETGYGDVEVEAKDSDEAESLVDKMLENGEIIFDDSSYDYDVVHIEPKEDK